MANSDIKLSIKGGALCAAFCFMVLFVPALGMVVNYFALLPLFYVGICLGIRAYLLAGIIPLTAALLILGPVGICFYTLTTFLPSFVVLYWHFSKNEKGYIFSLIDILHLLSSRFLGVVTLGFCYLKATNSKLLEGLFHKVELITNLAKLPSSSGSVIEVLPGVFCFLWLMMVWLNFQVAYSIALKSNKALRKPLISESFYLPPFWDIAFIGALWLIIANQLFMGSNMLGIFSRTALCISAFPLLIDGITIAKLMARSYKLPHYVTVILMVFIFLLVWPMVFVVVLGLIEPLYGLKKKYYSKLD